MNYTIDIIDAQDSTHTTVLEQAEKASLFLNWNGGDEKAVQNIVGSSLFFTMEVNIANSEDAAFIDLFTGNETRFKVRLYKTDDDVTIWSGFLLPDSYEEPYTNATFYPRFEATDGLGRLRGQTLPDDFYTNEKSVVEIIAKCLQLTGLQLPIYLAPAIENVNVKDYSLIYIDCVEFNAKSRKKKAYAVLEEVLLSMACVVYQAEDRWYIEGFNQRHLKNLVHFAYTYEGVLLETRKEIRLRKNLNPLDTPIVTVLPALSDFTVEHERVQQSLPETIAKEKNDGWAIGQGVEGDLYPTHWFSDNGYHPTALAPDYKVALRTRAESSFDLNRYIHLQEKIYCNRYDKLVFSGKFKTEIAPDLEDVVTNNGLFVQFLLNGNVLYEVTRKFLESELELTFDLYISEPGLLDFRIYQPFFEGTIQAGTYSAHIFLEELTVEVIGFEETEFFINEINDAFTIGDDIELPFSDDASGFSKAFRLQKLNEPSVEYSLVDVPVLYGFSQNNKFYSVVSLYGANLISDNIDSTYRGATLLQNLAVTYNYQNGEQMVIETDQAYTDGDFAVRRRRIEDVTEDRDHWENWTDAVYPIETDRYAESIAKVFRRLFPVAHERIEFLADAAFKFNDHIDFTYVLPRTYFLTNVSWNIDSGETNGVMVRNVYQNEIIDVGGDNVPPIVNAGEDAIMPANFGEFVPPFGTIKLFHNTASAFDPDGFIVSYLWSVESGDAGAVFGPKDNLLITLTRFIGESLTLRLTVVDSDGATAFDTVTFTKQNEYALVLTEDSNSRDNSIGNIEGFNRSILTVNPNLTANTTITIKGNFNLNILRIPSNGSYQQTLYFSVFKNGLRIIHNLLQDNRNPNKKEGDFEFNFINGDDIRFEIYGLSLLVGFVNNIQEFTSEYEITNVVFQNGGGVVTGYPIGKSLQYNHPSWLT